MPAEMPRPNPEGQKHRQLDREIREMVSTLTGRLTDLQQVHKPGSSHPLADKDEYGVQIITLAGTNTGATMRGEVLGRYHKLDALEECLEDELEGVEDTYVNSNYQAVNNTIMLGSSYTSNDPGVHMELVDVVDPPNIRPGRYDRRGMRKGKGLAEAPGNPHSELSG